MAAKSSGIILKTLLVIIMVLSLCPLMPMAKANAATRMVPEDYATIQAAVTAAVAGDTISVASGLYTEQVLVNKNLTIIGRDIDHPPTIQADPARTGLIGGSDYIVGATGCNLRLENIYINANGAAGPVPVGGANLGGVVMAGVTGAGAGIYDCYIYGFGGVTGDETYDVIVAEGSTLNIDGNNLTVYNCDIRGASGQECIWIDGGTATIDYNGIAGGYWGIASGRSAPSTDITVNDCYIRGQSIGGILIYRGGTVAISSNTIEAIAGTGIENRNLYPVTTGTISDNQIYDCVAAIDLQQSTSNWSLTGNMITDCTTLGVNSRCPLPVFSQNLVGNCGTGIKIYSNNLTAHCNAIMGNITAGLDLQSNGTFNVINNYWGANSGPNVNDAGPGTGDRIITNGHTVLTYDPWQQMTLSGTPASIAANGSAASTITLDCTHNSAGQVPGCVIPDGLPIQFTTTLGTLTSNTAFTSGGLASTTLRSDTTAGTAVLTSVITFVPTLTVSTAQVIFTAPEQPQEPVQQFVNQGPTSHGSSMPSAPVPQGPVQLSNVQVTSARLSTSHVNTGSPVSVTVEVTNTGGASGAAVVKVYLNGQAAGSQGVNVAAGSTAPVTLTVTPDKEGDYAVSVNGIQAGNLTVSGSGNPDMAFIIALAAFVIIMIALTVFYLRRRRAS
jgi:hypothetical protein